MGTILAGYYQYYQDAGFIRIAISSILFVGVGIGSVIDGPLIVGVEERRLLTKLQRISWCLVEAVCEVTAKMVVGILLFGMVVTSFEYRVPFSDFIGLMGYFLPLFVGTYIGRWGMFENPETDT